MLACEAARNALIATRANNMGRLTASGTAISNLIVNLWIINRTQAPNFVAFQTLMDITWEAVKRNLPNVLTGIIVPTVPAGVS